MSNQLEMAQRSFARAKRLYTYEELSHLISGDKRTIREMAKACGAYHPKSKTQVYIDYPRLEEYILSIK